MSQQTPIDSIRTGSGGADRDMGNSIHEKDGKCESNDGHPSSWRRPGEGPALHVLRWLARSLAIMALLSSFALLCVGATPFLTALPTDIVKVALRPILIKHLRLSALPLLLAGSSYVILQAILRPRPLELLKRLMLGVAFLLWGVVQLMPASDLAAELGNVVIALYLVDLALIIWGLEFPVAPASMRFHPQRTRDSVSAHRARPAA